MKRVLFALCLAQVLALPPSAARASCHELQQDAAYGGTNWVPAIDTLCLDAQAFVTLARNGRAVYSFQASASLTPRRWACGGREHDRCGWGGGDTQIEFEDSRASLHALLSQIPCTNFGAQSVALDGQHYLFWVRTPGPDCRKAEEARTR